MKHIDLIDARLESIKLPRAISRSLRKISQREYFHAYEWKYILLFAAYPVLHDIMDQKYFSHLVKLIEATHILCSTGIDKEQLDRADHLLQSFVKEFENLYGGHNMFFNVHLLWHSTPCVRKNGPLYAYSNYAFEDNIGCLQRSVLGPTDVLYQMCDRYLMKKSLELNLRSSEIAKEFNDQIKSHRFSKTTKLGDCILIGNRVEMTDPDECEFIRNQLQINRDEKISTYRAVFVNEYTFYETAQESAKIKTYDAFVCNSNSGIYAEIKHIIVARGSIYFFINNKYELDNTMGIAPFIFKILEKQDDFRIITPSQIDFKFALMKINNIVFCAKFPNLYERN